MSTTQDAVVNTEPVAPSVAVVKRVAARKGVDHTELVPLFEAIDPDALDGLVRTGRRNESAIHVTFTWNGCDVTVTGDGMVHLTAGDDIEG